MRTWAVLEALASLGHAVTMLTFADEAQASAEDATLRNVCEEVETISPGENSAGWRAGYAGRLLGIFSDRPFSVRRFASPAMRTRIERQLARNRFDVVICDTVYTGVNLPKTHIPILLNCHNVEHILLQRYIPIESNPLKRMYAWAELFKLRSWERRMGNVASLAMVCSACDRKLLAAMCPELNISVVPNIVDIEAYIPIPENDARTVLFQGAMDWFPNRDAVSFFADRVLPILRKRLPGVRFVVAGRNPPDEFCRRYGGIEGIEFTGEVPDLRAVIGAATVCVVPLRIGSGTRLKILEAAALAKPIVSTRVGAEGLDFEDGKEILLADEPAVFADAVFGLLNDSELRKSIGSAARLRVEEQYGVPALRAAIDLALSHLPVANRAAASAATLRPDSSPVHP